MRGKIVWLPVLALLLLSLAGCRTGVENRVAAATRVDPRLVRANTEFAFRLFEELGRHETGNIFISPASIAIALAMTFNGADGITKDEMAGVMSLNDLNLTDLNLANADLLSILGNPDREVTINLANSLWAAEDARLDQDFVNNNKKYYQAEVSRLSFASAGAAETINKWVADRTNNMIKQLFDNLPGRTRLVLVNALYFKGAWTAAFDVKDTADANFYLADGTSKKVPMMYQKNNFHVLQGDGFRAVRLPYGDGRINMYVFVPEDLTSFSRRLTQENWKNWTASFAEREDTVVYLPRFGIDYKVELNDALIAMGMPSAFGFGAAADFSKMTPGGGWHIDLVVHQANIDVHEEGTEAAAATGVVMVESAQIAPFTVRADRPFFIAICDDLTGSVLFMGTVKDPQ